MTAPRFTPLVASLPSSVPFVGPEAQERARGSRFRARLGANESPFGPSPSAVEAMARAAADVWKYADPENHDLRLALAKRHGVAPERIAIGEGIDGLLGLYVRLFVGEGTPVVTSLGAYPTFNFHVAGFGGRLVTAPYRDDREDWQALAALVAETGAPLVYFANPDNPMGTWHDASTVARLLDTLPPTATLCLDEAYIEFAPDGVALPDDFERPRLVRFRTFSKAYGMAGSRIGYVITSPELAKATDKVRNHFGVNMVALAGAFASLGDPAHLARVKANVVAAKARIAAIGASHGLSALPSATNFVTLDTGRDGTVARALVAALGRRGVFIRMPFVAPGDRCIRVSAGPDDLLDVFEAELGPALSEVLTRAAAE